MAASPLCVIPARGGSKRLARKNVLLLAGRPMLAYTIDAARDSGVFEEVIVSTEDAEIARIAGEHGASVHARPQALAGDMVSATDVCIDVCETRARKGQHYDALVCLQPSSPLRSSTDIAAAWNAFTAAGAAFLVSGTVIDPHYFHWAIAREGDWWRMVFGATYLKERSLLPDRYRPNGAIKIGRIPDIIHERNFFGEELEMLEMPEARSVHVATAFDLALAEALMRRES